MHKSLRAHALSFLDAIQATETRRQEVLAEIAETGTYRHTPEELVSGARLAWRNSNRCVGRHMWRSLHVFDAREVRDAAGVQAQLESHLAFAFHGGAIRSAITVFAPRPPEPGTPDVVRVANHQLLRYAGFAQPDGRVIGDPHSAAFTQRCRSAGWEPKCGGQGAHTLLPWVIEIDGVPQPPIDVCAQRPDLAPEVDIVHPEAGPLGLRWYAVPLLSDMVLVIGGVVYPCAPFNGFYLGTEIGARNLADASRYDALPQVARALGLDTRNPRTLWRDRALVELNRAVLHSFDTAGIRLADHHQLGDTFEAFCQAEEAAGRTVTGDWAWLVPPLSGALTPQFHREFDNEVVRHTNFFYAPALPSEKPDAAKCPFHL
ncbi:MAG: Nitric oxide synthase oxygenase [Bacteroidota bacterium]|jgi:nitric-oxide synthase